MYTFYTITDVEVVYNWFEFFKLLPCELNVISVKINVSFHVQGKGSSSVTGTSIYY